MARRRSDEGEIDFKQMMKTPLGHWFLVPALIAVLAIGGWGLILTTFSLQNGLPQWVYGAPGGLALIAYYGIEGRKAWRLHIKPDITIAKDSNVAKQTVKGGSVAPTFQGDGNVINNTFIQHAPPPKSEPAPPHPTIVIQPHVVLPTSSHVPVAPPAPPPAAPEVPVKVGLKDRPMVSKAAPEVIHDGPLKVKAANREVIEFAADKGDVLKGSVFSSAPLYAWIWTEAAVARYHGTKSIGAALICNNTSAGVIDLEIPETGRYYLILDAKGKKSGRNALVRLERVVAVKA